MRVATLAQDVPDIPLEGLTAWDWIYAGIILAAGILLAVIVNRLLRRLLARAGVEKMAARIVGRLVGYVVGAAAFGYALASLDIAVAPLVGALGLGGLALAFALQDTLQNFIAGLMLETRRPFRRGDQIRTNDYEGTVEDINLRNTIIRTFDGKKVVIPNSMIMNNPIENWVYYGSRRTTLIVGVAYDTPLPGAKEVIERAVRGAEGVLDFPSPQAFVEEFADSSINFAVHFWHAPGRASVWAVRSAVAIAVKQALDEAAITIPFPQRTIWYGPEA